MFVAESYEFLPLESLRNSFISFNLDIFYISYPEKLLPFHHFERSIPQALSVSGY
jgi:hypothetical protein